MVGQTNRRAIFECVICIALPSGPALRYQARCQGLLTEKPVGENGFGYDPVFYYPPLKKTFAELSREEKNRVSHRGKALHQVRDEFDKILIWIKQHTLPQEKLIGKTDYTLKGHGP
jgi:XTP/dITP diphosphohydrolase